MEITITKAEYDSLLESKTRLIDLEKKVSDLQEEAKNKAIALDEERKKSKAKAEEAKNLISEKENELEKLKASLELQENETLEEKINQLKEGNQKYSEILAQKEADRIKNIEEYKTFLGEDFLKEQAGFLDGLPEEKIEIYLKTQAESKGFGKNNDENKPKVGLHNNGQAPQSGESSDFEKMLNSGASVSDLINSLE
ncbi:hypothetical protein BKN14_00390 [Candidatus Gracilibacteria bacterium HOT-871]|nr:hypothetical protein BKN14_00390 [Candidatus Gracilibacteria bacterium HOT-871]